MIQMFCGVVMRANGAAPGLGGMLAALPRRRADAHSAWTDGAAALGWRGPAGPGGYAAPAMPLVEPAAGLALTAGARLDDRDALCDRLDVPRPQRADLADAALVLRAWRRWGRECPHHLLGDYAFALWDQPGRALFCARDAAGAQPFYYSLTPRLLAFASTVDAVLAAPGVSDALDEAAVVTWLTRMEPLPPPHTFFRAVRRLPPGHALAVEGGAVRTVRWWRPEDAPAVRLGADEQYAEAFRERYARAVADRVRGAGDVGVGVHLSGGLDSSSVAVLAARELRRRGRPDPRAFTWLPPPPALRPLTADEIEEYCVVEAVRRQEALPLHYRPARDVAAVLALLRRDRLREGGDAPEIEEQVQRCAAGQGVRVMLSGWGGDEGISFNGRGYYPGLLLAGRAGRLWREARALGRSPLRRVLRRAVLPLVLPRAHYAAPWVMRRLRGGEWFVPPRPFVHPVLARRVRPLPAKPYRETGVRATQLALLEMGHLSGRMEGWAASGARHGIEYRYPLLDRRVIEFSLGLPPEQYVRGRWLRWLMRYALQPLLPPALCWRRKEENPTRAEHEAGIVAEAFSVLRRDLAARAAPPPRAAWLDMPRLMEALRREDLHASPRGGRRCGGR